MTDEPQAQTAMLTLLREARGLTQAEVAAAMTEVSGDAGPTVSQGYISKAESGRLIVTGERLDLYAAALGYPPELLCLDPQVHGVGVGLIHHRKRASLQVSALRRIHAQLVLTRIQLSGLTAAAKTEHLEPHFPHVELDDLTLPRDAARRLRKEWRLPSGPVSDVVGAAEDAGAWVVLRDLESDLLDAVSQRADENIPLFLVNNRVPGDRCRFSMAHEIGHIILHTEPGPGGEQEKQADAFAAEFLMPAKDIRADFSGDVAIPKLKELKRKWRVSMAALLRRARSLNTITEWQYRNIIVEMSALGYRTAEPMDIPLEQPCRVSRLVDSLREEHGFTDQQAADRSYLLLEDFVCLYREDNDPLVLNTVSKVRP